MSDIAVYLDLTEPQRQRLLASVGTRSIVFCTPDTPCQSPVIFGNPAAAMVSGNANLRWMQTESVGVAEYAQLDWQRPHGLARLTNLAGFFADPVAETALAGLLALGRGLQQLIPLRDRAEWVGAAIRAELRLLTGAQVVLFGRGAINQRLAQLLAPFGCQITRFGSDWTAQALDAALLGADVVAATVPDTPRTRGVFDATRIGLLKPGAIFCNLGRGSLVDETALSAALLSGRLGGAVIDVTRDEPLPVGHSFWTTPNTILTQHSGGGSQDEVDRKIGVFLANLARFDQGQDPAPLVDFARGY